MHEKQKKCKKKWKICHNNEFCLYLQKILDLIMAAQITRKKNLVTSFHNLAPELQEAVKAAYPAGFSEVMMRVEKPNGDFFYAVPFETEEVAYLVKIDVKIDDASIDDDKDFFDDEELKGAEELQDESAMGVEEGEEMDL